METKLDVIFGAAPAKRSSNLTSKLSIPAKLKDVLCSHRNLKEQSRFSCKTCRQTIFSILQNLNPMTHKCMNVTQTSTQVTRKRCSGFKSLRLRVSPRSRGILTYCSDTKLSRPHFSLSKYKYTPYGVG
jgi:hypothetical protein